MKKLTICAAVLVSAALTADCKRAAAACGAASAYTPGGGAQGVTSNHWDIAAAHASLPLGSRVIVRSQRSGRSIIVRIADRSPDLLGQIINLSADAMRALEMDVLAPVCLEVISYGSERHGYQNLMMRNPLAQAHKLEGRSYAKAGGAARAVHSKNSGMHNAEARYRRSKHDKKLHRLSQSVKGLGHRRRPRAYGVPSLRGRFRSA